MTQTSSEQVHTPYCITQHCVMPADSRRFLILSWVHQCVSTLLPSTRQCLGR